MAVPMNVWEWKDGKIKDTSERMLICDIDLSSERNGGQRTVHTVPSGAHVITWTNGACTVCACAWACDRDDRQMIPQPTVSAIKLQMSSPVTEYTKKIHIFLPSGNLQNCVFLDAMPALAAGRATCHPCATIFKVKAIKIKNQKIFAKNDTHELRVLVFYRPARQNIWSIKLKRPFQAYLQAPPAQFFILSSTCRRTSPWHVSFVFKTVEKIYICMCINWFWKVWVGYNRPFLPDRCPDHEKKGGEIRKDRTV